jgi:putative chitinase
MITVEQFHKLFPNCVDSQGWVTAMESVLPANGINTPDRIASFLAQCGHESGGWTKFEENLNYGAPGLLSIFKKYFPNETVANQYARKPEMIANRVYAGRMGNGSPESGDGWKYRGRGPIQITGKDNITAFAKKLVPDWQKVVDNPSLISTDKNLCLLSAIWFWDTNNLNKYADAKDIKTMTRIINGGYNGIDERIKLYNEAIHLLT